MKDSDYCGFLKSIVISGLQLVLPADEQQEMRLKELYIHAAAETLFAPEEAPIARRLVIAYCVEEDADVLKQYCQYADQQDHPDPWAYQTMQGYYHRQQAWKERGDGWASEVTDEGWRGFAERLAKARQHLVKAWSINPKLPEAPLAMIGVIMGGGEQYGETERLWFDRTVQAQFDYPPAYSAMLWAKRPRWGGSYEEMYRFALECLQTQRFDTDVPLCLMECLRDIRNEMRGSYAFWRRPDVTAALDRMFEGVIAEPVRAADRDYLKTFHAATAWRVGHEAQARKILDELGERRSSKPWRWVNAAEEYAVMQIYARTGPAGAMIRQADAELDRREWMAAMSIYQQVKASDVKDHHTRNYVKEQLQRIRWQLAYAAGKAVNLTPDEDLRSKDRLTGWRVFQGKWKVSEDGAIVGTADSEGLMALADFDPENRWVVTGMINFMYGKPYKERSAGIITRFIHFGEYWGWTFYPEDDAVVSHFDMRTNLRKRASVPEVVPFRVERWRGAVTVECDGKRIFENDHNGPDTDDHHLMGLSGRDSREGDVVRFESLQIRQLQNKPAWAGE